MPSSPQAPAEQWRSEPPTPLRLRIPAVPSRQGPRPHLVSEAPGCPDGRVGVARLLRFWVSFLVDTRFGTVRLYPRDGKAVISFKCHSGRNGSAGHPRDQVHEWSQTFAGRQDTSQEICSRPRWRRDWRLLFAIAYLPVFGSVRESYSVNRAPAG